VLPLLLNFPLAQPVSGESKDLIPTDGTDPALLGDAVLPTADSFATLFEGLTAEGEEIQLRPQAETETTVDAFEGEETDIDLAALAEDRPSAKDTPQINIEAGAPGLLPTEQRPPRDGGALDNPTQAAFIRDVDQKPQTLMESAIPAVKTTAFVETETKTLPPTALNLKSENLPVSTQVGAQQKHLRPLSDEPQITLPEQARTPSLHTSTEARVPTDTIPPKPAVGTVAPLAEAPSARTGPASLQPQSATPIPSLSPVQPSPPDTAPTIPRVPTGQPTPQHPTPPVLPLAAPPAPNPQQPVAKDTLHIPASIDAEAAPDLRTPPLPQRPTAPTAPTLPSIQPAVRQIPKEVATPTSLTADTEPLPSLRSDAPQGTYAISTSPQPYRTDVAQHIASQLADAAKSMPARQVEIALSHEELGRVRLGVAPQEAGILVHVFAERPETMDLLRRHIAALETAFAAIGYEDINFAFAGGASTEGDGASDSSFSDTEAEPLTAPPEVITQITLETAALGGIDIRL